MVKQNMLRNGTLGDMHAVIACEKRLLSRGCCEHVQPITRQPRELTGLLSAGQGEGEVKIMSRLMRPWADVAPGDTHAVVADDSDCLLMAAMAASRQNQHIFVLSEAQEGRSIVFGPDGVARGTVKEGLEPAAKAAGAKEPPAKGRLHPCPQI